MSCNELFVQQGAANSGWVSDAILRGFDGTGLDTQRMLDGMHSPGVERQLVAAQSAATAVGVSGTPFFRAGRTGAALVHLEVGSLDPEAFRLELDQLLAK